MLLRQNNQTWELTNFKRSDDSNRWVGYMKGPTPKQMKDPAFTLETDDGPIRVKIMTDYACCMNGVEVKGLVDD